MIDSEKTVMAVSIFFSKCSFLALLLLSLLNTGCSVEVITTPRREIHLDFGSFLGQGATPFQKLSSKEDGYSLSSSVGGIVPKAVDYTEDMYWVYLTNQSILLSFEHKNSEQ